MRYPLFLSALMFTAAATAQTDSPSEEQKTQDLNQNQTSQSQQSDAQYREQQELYRQQQQDYQAQKQQYESQAARYLAARDRYAAERARYRRGDWPQRYEKLAFVESETLMDAPVETYAGTHVGRVEEVAKKDGRIDAVRIALSGGTSHVWVDRGDLKFDAGDRVLVTDLAMHDLYSMSHEEY